MSLPIVFLHGFLGTCRDWDRVIPFLPDFSCSAFDLPGHGKVPFSDSFSFLPPAPKFHLVGYSMGGRLAMQYAVKHPEKIGQLLLISTHPGLSSEKERIERLKTDEEWARLLLESPIDTFLKHWYEQPIFAGFQPDLTERKTRDPKLLAKVLVHYSLAKQPLLHIEKAIHLVGGRDTKFRALHPNAIQIENAGHMIHLEQPAALANAIRDLLQRFSTKK